MSLSSWFRDYLYIPLGGNRRGTGRTYLNLVIVFVLCGLWHGASWTFLVWGLYHGLFLVVERMGLGRVLARLPRPLQHGYLIVTVMGGWVLFRAETFEQATAFLAAMAGFAAGDGLEHNVPYYLTWPVGVTLLVGAAAATGLLPAALRMLGRARRSLSPVPARILGVASVWTETAGLAALLTACAMHIATSAYSPFIYFRF
jgi:alginate O-acetyltransferase complex protein AlgI